MSLNTDCSVTGSKKERKVKVRWCLWTSFSKKFDCEKDEGDRPLAGDSG